MDAIFFSEKQQKLKPHNKGMEEMLCWNLIAFKCFLKPDCYDNVSSLDSILSLLIND